MIVEIKFGAGGLDSKIFVHELLAVYVKYGQSKGFSSELLISEEGHVLVKFGGDGVWNCFKFETGQHCVQRIGTTEANGRRHTSFVSVAVLPIPEEKILRSLPEQDIEFSYMRGSGPGGQNRNKVCSCVRAIYRPTKLEVVIDGRDQGKNKSLAVRILTAKFNKIEQEKKDQDYNRKRKILGQGGRGETEKIRTYNFLKNFAIDHRTGKKTSNVKAVMKGDLDLLI